MGSEPDDDDARSFGSEPDFAAMSSLRISSGTDAGPSPNGGHVFDELLDDPPGPSTTTFARRRRRRCRRCWTGSRSSCAATVGRATKMTTAVRDGEREDGAGPIAPAPAGSLGPAERHGARRGARAKASRRVRTRAGFAPALDHAVDQCQWVPAPPETRAGQPRRRDPHAAAADDDDDDDDEPASSSSPWIEAMQAAPRGVVVRRGEGAGVLHGHRTRVRRDADRCARSRTFDERRRGRRGGTGTRPVDETTRRSDTFAVAHSCAATDEDDESDARRWRLGVPCLDPETVIALDLAFARGEVCAGEVEPRPCGSPAPSVRVTTMTMISN